MTNQQIIDKYLNDFTKEHGKPVPDELNLYIHKIINQALYLDAVRRLPVDGSVCKCPVCLEEMKGIELIHYKCKKCNEYFTN